MDSLKFEEIVDPYGPPRRNLSFARDSLMISSEFFERGLGVHAPSDLHINLEGKGLLFEAKVGIDDSAGELFVDSLRQKVEKRADYVYWNQIDHYDFTAGGSVVFKIYGDGEVLWESDTIKYKDSALNVNVVVEDVERLRLVVENANDGSYADYANWASAKLFTRDSAFKPVIYHHPGQILVNHVGYLPDEEKTFVLPADSEVEFELIEVEGEKSVFKGITQRKSNSDLGDYSEGEFSSFKEPGVYYIRCDGMRSENFQINSGIIETCLNKHMEYYTLQRSGHPEKGWAPGQHLDDGVRMDNGKHQNVTGGWYDASDIRKATKGDAMMLFAISEVLSKAEDSDERARIIEEIKWGTKFLFSMQEPQGYLMKYIGYTWEGYADNRWTDNEIGTKDDRTIITSPAEIQSHLMFIAACFRIADELELEDPAYARECFNRGVKALQWVRNTKENFSLRESAKMIYALVNLSLVDSEKLPEGAIEKHVEYIQASMNYSNSNVLRYIKDSKRNRIQDPGFILASFVHLIEMIPDHPSGQVAEKVCISLIDDYYLKLSTENVFGIIPWILSENEMNTGQQVDGIYYKYFLHVGMNQHLGWNGFGLAKAAKFFGNEKLFAMAYDQLSWIYGKNPYNASTVTEIGNNQPDLFKTGGAEFTPPTPPLTGGVMTGIGGTQEDDIALYPGWWWTTEYWAPTVSATVCLVNEIANN